MGIVLIENAISGVRRDSVTVDSCGAYVCQALSLAFNLFRFGQLFSHPALSLRLSPPGPPLSL